jgi:ferric-dicitrate binding protein FerR (iron transport regulator)
MKDIEKYIDNALFFRWVYEPNDDLNNYWNLYISNHPDEKELLLSLKNELQDFQIRNEQLSESRKKELSNRISGKIRQERHKGKIRELGKLLLKYAALAILFGMIGGGIVFLQYKKEPQFENFKYFGVQEIAGTPTLILSDGSKINLDSHRPTIKFVGNQIEFNNDSAIAIPQSGDLLNQLIMPYGCRGQIVLADQSVIWLNAGSRLLFPTIFTADERNVFLFGEAFFEIEQDKQKPFRVETADYNIRVLGTKFNVSAYPGDNLSQAVLAEGSIKLMLKRDKWFSSGYYLKPNQMLSYSHQTGEVNMQKVDPDLYTLWKDGLVPFKNESFSKVIEKIERYYDIQIKLENPDDGNIKLDGKLNLKNDKYEVLYYITKVANRKFIEKNEKYFVVR